MAFEPETTTIPVDFPKDAPTRRELAWELLKQTRNAAYVALRYEYPIPMMEEALKKIPIVKTVRERLAEQNALHDAHRRQARERALQEDAKPTREPGEDDEG